MCDLTYFWHIFTGHLSDTCKKVQVGNDQEKTQSEKDPHPKNRSCFLLLFQTLAPGASTSVTIPILYDAGSTWNVQFDVKFVPNDPTVPEERVTVTILEVPPVVTTTDYTVLEDETTLSLVFSNVSPGPVVAK